MSRARPLRPASRAVTVSAAAALCAALARPAVADEPTDAPPAPGSALDALGAPPSEGDPVVPAVPGTPSPEPGAPDAGPTGEPVAAEVEAPAPSPSRRLVVVDAAAYGVAPVVAQHVTAELRTVGEALGYALIPRDATVAAAQRIRMPYPPTPADLWRVTYAAEADRGVFARVWAEAGRYVVELAVASMDGTGPFFARGAAPAEGLREEVARMLRQALPSASLWSEGRAAEGGEVSGPPVDLGLGGAPTGPAGGGGPAEGAVQGPAPIGRRWKLSGVVEGAVGTSKDSFFNLLIGTRVDLRVSSAVLVGASLSYANLRGKNGRVGNLLPALQIEDRIRISAGSDLTVPLRFGLGYLPFNGPVVRLAAGLNVPIGEALELSVDILAPTFWVLPDRTAVSLDLAAEVGWRF